jgi:GNAT superfamily N-acetyltransferase
MVLYYCDLFEQRRSTSDLPDGLTVDRKREQTDLGPRDLQEIVSFWNPKLARRRINERFECGASLWLIRSEGRLAGFGWTLRGYTVEPHYFPLGAEDVHLFDFYVFPQFRGRRLNPLLVGTILRNLADECHGRAFIEAAEWNQNQMASLQRTAFQRLGLATKFTLLRRTIVRWDEKNLEQRTLGRARNSPLGTSDSEDAKITGVRA